jgi:alpha-N-arabinofuranosidase
MLGAVIVDFVSLMRADVRRNGMLRSDLLESLKDLAPPFIRWTPGTIDAIATASSDGRRIVIKAVNYGAGSNTLLVKLTGAQVLEKAVATLQTITAPAKTMASLERPNIIAPVTRTIDYSKDLTLDVEPLTVIVVEIRSA